MRKRDTNTKSWINFIVVFFVLIFLPEVVIGSTKAPPVKCSDRYLKYALQRCNQDLADISSSILVLLKNNTVYKNKHICSNFKNYVECVGPNVKDCQSLLLEHYYHDVFIYSSPPYGCDIPDVSHLPATKIELPFNHSPKMVIQDFQLSQKVGILTGLLKNSACCLVGYTHIIITVGMVISLLWTLIYV